MNRLISNFNLFLDNNIRHIVGLHCFQMNLPDFWNIYSQIDPYHTFPKATHQHKGKYKRSTNNSHKKFICVARKLLLKGCTLDQRLAFQKQFQSHKNSRTYFFIILAHVKLRMNPQKAKYFINAFVLSLNRKIQLYHQEIQNTANNNFIHFRFEQIADIEFAIKALNLYFDGHPEQAIQTVYRKDRLTLFKRQQYDLAVKTILQLQKKLKSFPPGSLFPYYSAQIQNQDQYKSEEEPQDPQQQLVQKHSQQNQSSDEQWEEQDDESVLLKKNKLKNKKLKELQHPLKKIKYQQTEPQMPLLFLQNSYPYFPHFFETLYKYGLPLLQIPNSHHFQNQQLDYSPFYSSNPKMRQPTNNSLNTFLIDEFKRKTEIQVKKPVHREKILQEDQQHSNQQLFQQKSNLRDKHPAIKKDNSYKNNGK